MVLRGRSTGGRVQPCLPTTAKQPPSGLVGIHEIKHDGFRIIARLDGENVRLYSRKGNDLSRRFPLIRMAIALLPAKSCLIDGEAIVCNEAGLAVFDLIRGHAAIGDAVHCAFDLLELDGEDLRRLPIEARKAQLANSGQAPSSIVLNEHYEGDGAII